MGASLQPFDLQENFWDLKKQDIHLIEPNGNISQVEFSFLFIQKQK